MRRGDSDFDLLAYTTIDDTHTLIHNAMYDKEDSLIQKKFNFDDIDNHSNGTFGLQCSGSGRLLG